MPVSIADFNRQRRTFTMDSELGPVRWTYFPYRMTLAREAEVNRLTIEMTQKASAMEAAASRGDDGAIERLLAEIDRAQLLLAEQFCEVVAATDMIGPLHAKIDPVTMEGIGEPIVPAGDTLPMRPDVVQHFSSRYIKEVLAAISADARPKETPTPTP